MTEKVEFDHKKLIAGLEALNASLPSIHPEPFYQTMIQFLEIMNLMGSFLQMAFKDVNTKVEIIKSNFESFPRFKGGITEFIRHEHHMKIHALNGENPSKAPEPRYRDYVSTARTFLRLVWFFDFVAHLLQHIESDRTIKLSCACKAAYKEALGPHHNLPVRMIAKAAMNFVPSRENLLVSMFPEGVSEEEKYKTLRRIIDLLGPIRKSLWDFYHKNNLTKLS